METILSEAQRERMETRTVGKRNPLPEERKDTMLHRTFWTEPEYRWDEVVPGVFAVSDDCWLDANR